MALPSGPVNNQPFQDEDEKQTGCLDSVTKMVAVPGREAFLQSGNLFELVNLLVCDEITLLSKFSPWS